MMRKIKAIKMDRKAGIEGLPLQLMIMVVIAGIGTTVILGWMSGLQPPASIGSVHAYPGEVILTDADGDGIFQTNDLTIQVTVLDREGNGIQGATVLLEGAGVSYLLSDGTVHGMTDSSGKLSLSGLKASLAGGPMGFITVTVTKSGYGAEDRLQVPVICE
ncbi:MAG TPA: carboxypeptidase-like regulatory domain-containing protein [Methanomassiliicoccales archaeon]|nr:carboxypeptidase-like regulatory domain-containing protein [Methanomassiliicoccales archaeon]